MEYNQFSDIKGIFKNFFHKKEDFNNKGLISKKENFNNSTTDDITIELKKMLLYIITFLMYMWSLWMVGLAPSWEGFKSHTLSQRAAYAVISFLYVSFLFFGQYYYYYYLGGEDEINEMAENDKLPRRALIGGVPVVLALTFALRHLRFDEKTWIGRWFTPPRIPQPDIAPPPLSRGRGSREIKVY